MGRRGSITIEDVARAAGVSKATVSKALNHPDGEISAETIERIQGIARQLGYRPATLRPQLRNIGLVTGALAPASSGAFAGFLEAVMGESLALGLRAHLVPVSQSPLDLVEERSRLRLAGVLVADPMPPGLDAWLVQDGMPAVLFNQYSDQALDQVRPDDDQACRLLGDHLRSLGHQRIAFLLRRRTTPHPSEPARVAAFERWCLEQGIQATVIIGSEPAWMAALAEVTAVIVYNTDDAVRLLTTAKAAGRMLPDSLAIAAFDDPAEASLVDPPLTGVSISHDRSAREAVRLLQQRIDLPRRSPQIVRIPGDLKVRTSSTGFSGR